MRGGGNVRGRGEPREIFAALWIWNGTPFFVRATFKWPQNGLLMYGRRVKERGGI